MKQHQRSWAYFALLMGLSSAGFSQQGSTAAGGDASGSGGTVAYSVGQVVYTTHTGSNGSVAQGVQQAYIISSGGVEEPGISLSVSVYPNPTSDYLTLSVAGDLSQALSYELFDMNGKHLSGDRITASQTQVSMLTLVPATYYVKVSRGKAPVKTFTIIKTF